MSKRKLWCMILLAGQTIQPYNFETTCFLCYYFYLFFFIALSSFGEKYQERCWDFRLEKGKVKRELSFRYEPGQNPIKFGTLKSPTTTI